MRNVSQLSPAHFKPVRREKHRDKNLSNKIKTVLFCVHVDLITYSKKLIVKIRFQDL